MIQFKWLSIVFEHLGNVIHRRVKNCYFLSYLHEVVGNWSAVNCPRDSCRRSAVTALTHQRLHLPVPQHDGDGIIRRLPSVLSVVFCILKFGVLGVARTSKHAVGGFFVRGGGGPLRCGVVLQIQLKLGWRN